MLVGLSVCVTAVRRLEQRLAERFTERGMRVNEAGCVGERHMVADQLFASAMMSEAIWETMCTPSTRGVSGVGRVAAGDDGQ